MSGLNDKSCPCGNGDSYEECCYLIHKDLSKAITAQSLMQSRYTGFTKAMGDYLMDSHHSSTRPVSEKNDIINWAKSVEWVRLEILNITKGSANDNEGTVEFKAFFYTKNGVNKVLDCIHENSKFVKENNLWMYLGIAS